MLLSLFFKKKEKKKRKKKSKKKKVKRVAILEPKDATTVGVILARFPYKIKEAINILTFIIFEGSELTLENL